MKQFTRIFLLFSLLAILTSCLKEDTKQVPFDWKNATVYFLLTDRFENGDLNNDINFNRDAKTKQLRNFTGGDFAGITNKLHDGYFNDLGVDALWFSPVNEQIHGSVDEGQGETYAFHGYWIKDWTSIEPNWGTEEELKELVKIAHEKGIRVILDVIINHTGPVTKEDPVWPSDWVRTEPQCSYQDFESTVFCTLVKNLPDIITEQTSEVQLPKQLVEKWKKEGRYEKEVEELDAFFERTGYPRTPRYYIIKWITDFIRKYGIDGFRIDTVKHTEPDVWADLSKESRIAFADWKKNNHEAIQEGQEFFILGETYNYNALNGRGFDFGDTVVDYYDYGFDSQINFGFKGDAKLGYEELFSRYSNQLSTELSDVTTMNYISSHDDSWPFDKERKRTFESATKLLLCPGQVQIYYGDETSRPLTIEGAIGDVNLRGQMNWGENPDLLEHWQKLGKFRHNHPSIGAGTHIMIARKPYVFARKYIKPDYKDVVVVALDLPNISTEIKVTDYFADGEILYDAYGEKKYEVVDGKIDIVTSNGIVLLEDFTE